LYRDYYNRIADYLSTESGRKAEDVFLLLVAFAIFVLNIGYCPYAWNHALQLPLVYRIVDPRLFPNDPLVDAVKYNCSPHWYVIGYLARIVPLEWLLACLYFSSRFLMIAAAFCLARVLLPDVKLAAYASALVYSMFPMSLIGGGMVFQEGHDHSSMCNMVLLWATFALLRRRYTMFGLLMGVAFNLNIIYAVAAMTYFGVAILFVYGKEEKKRLLLPSLVMTLMALPAIWNIVGNARQAVSDFGQWFAVLRYVQDWHTFPLSWSWKGWVAVSVFIIVTVYLVASLWKVYPILSRLSLAWTGVGIFWLIVGFFSAYIYQNRLLLSFQPARAMDFWFVSSTVWLVCLACAHFIAHGSSLQGVKKILPPVALLFAYGIWRTRFVEEAFTLVIFQLLLMAVATTAGTLILLKHAPDTRKALTAIVAGYYVVGLLSGLIQVYRRDGIVISTASRYPKAYAQIAHWARVSTPLDSVFLVPFTWRDFRLDSRRAAFLTVKDSGLIGAAPSYLPYWVERMVSVGVNPVALGEKGLKRPFMKLTPYRLEEFWNSLYSQIDDAKAQSLAQRFGITHWVLEERRSTRFPEVYRAEGWKVVRVPPRQQEKTSPPPPHPSPGGIATGDSPTRAAPPGTRR
jgi:hypothetical protein